MNVRGRRHEAHVLDRPQAEQPGGTSDISLGVDPDVLQEPPSEAPLEDAAGDHGEALPFAVGEQRPLLPLQGLPTWVVLGKAGEFALDPDEGGSLGLSVLLQPVGEGWAKPLVVGVGDDGLEEVVRSHGRASRGRVEQEGVQRARGDQTSCSR